MAWKGKQKQKITHQKPSFFCCIVSKVYSRCQHSIRNNQIKPVSPVVMYQPPKPKALHFWEFCNRIQLGRGLHSACCELDYKMCSLRRLVCWGEIWELFWVWSWSQLKKWKPTLEKIFIGEDEISPNELYNYPFCLGSLSEDLHCSYCWRWWFLGKKFTTDLKLGEFRKEWNEFGEHIKSACCFMALAGQKKSKTNGFSKSCSVFFCVFSKSPNF